MLSPLVPLIPLPTDTSHCERVTALAQSQRAPRAPFVCSQKKVRSTNKRGPSTQYFSANIEQASFLPQGAHRAYVLVQGRMNLSVEKVLCTSGGRAHEKSF
jgi:hypothetical protein